MADTPCSCCNRGYSGRAFIAYINFYDERELVQRRLRLCVDCIADHFLILVENGDYKNERKVWCAAREQQWDSTEDAHSETTQNVLDAARELSQHRAIPTVSDSKTEEPTSNSVGHATTQSQSQPSPSSKQSAKRDTSRRSKQSTP